MIFDNNHLDVLNPSLCDINNFVYRRQEGFFDIWYHPRTNRHYEEYRLYKINKEDLNIFNERKQTTHNFVQVHYVSIREEAGYSHLRVFTERIVLKLSQIQTLNLEQGLIIMSETLKGFMRCYQKFGSINISSKMICINEEGRVKVWVNEEYYKNQRNKPTEGLCEKSIVCKILASIETRMIESKNYQQYLKKKHERLNQITFDSALGFIEDICKEMGIDSKQKIEISNLTLGAEKISQKLKFLKKTSLKRNNRHEIQFILTQKKNQIKPQLSNHWTLQKTQSVKYFNDVPQNRERSQSNFSQRLSFGSRSRTNSLTASHKLSSPKTLMNRSNACQSPKAVNLKASRSTNSQIKTISNTRNQSPPLSLINQYFQPSTRSLQNVKLVKQSIINHDYQQPSPQNAFKNLKFFNQIGDLKKSQYFTEGDHVTPNTTSFVRSNSMLFKSIIFEADIKEISQNIEEESEELL